MKPEVRDRVLARLRRVEGQMAGIQRMVEQERHCVEILHPVAAAEAALERVGHAELASHVDTCVSNALESGRPAKRKRKMKERLEVFSRFGRVRP